MLLYRSLSVLMMWSTSCGGEEAALRSHSLRRVGSRSCSQALWSWLSTLSKSVLLGKLMGNPVRLGTQWGPSAFPILCRSFNLALMAQVMTMTTISIITTIFFSLWATDRPPEYIHGFAVLARKRQQDIDRSDRRRSGQASSLTVTVSKKVLLL